MGAVLSFPGFFKRVAPTHAGDGEGAGLAESAAQAWLALPGLVKARVCARGAHKTGAVGARDQRREHAAGTLGISSQSAGVRACAERAPGDDLPAPALPRARPPAKPKSAGGSARRRAPGGVPARPAPPSLGSELASQSPPRFLH